MISEIINTISFGFIVALSVYYLYTGRRSLTRRTSTSRRRRPSSRMPRQKIDEPVDSMTAVFKGLSLEEMALPLHASPLRRSPVKSAVVVGAQHITNADVVTGSSDSTSIAKGPRRSCLKQPGANSSACKKQVSFKVLAFEPSIDIATVHVHEVSPIKNLRKSELYRDAGNYPHVIGLRQATSTRPDGIPELFFKGVGTFLPPSSEGIYGAQPPPQKSNLLTHLPPRFDDHGEEIFPRLPLGYEYWAYRQMLFHEASQPVPAPVKKTDRPAVFEKSFNPLNSTQYFT